MVSMGLLELNFFQGGSPISPWHRIVPFTKLSSSDENHGHVSAFCQMRVAAMMPELHLFSHNMSGGLDCVRLPGNLDFGFG